MESTMVPASGGGVIKLHYFILRRSYKHALLHHEEEIPGLIDLSQG
jgi:hypothetical protein